MRTIAWNHLRLVLALFIPLVTITGCPAPNPTPMPDPSDNLAADAAQLLAAFDLRDENNDGLSIEEARRELNRLSQETFDAIDEDNNGLLSEVELARAAGQPLPDPDRDGESDEMPMTNLYSWDGSWSPLSDELPPVGFYDSIYFDGHEVNGAASPILPPGVWDFFDANQNRVFLLANHRNFTGSTATILELMDESNRSYGWRYDPLDRSMPDFTGPVSFVQGSTGTDIIDAGKAGLLKSGALRMGDGPDILRYGRCNFSDIRTGSSLDGNENDNDLVIGGDEILRDIGDPAMIAATIHTGPGSDLVFINNIEQAAIDLGNGADGRTDTIDPNDGDDMVIIGLNFRDTRIFGGNGDDVFVWYIDEEGPTDKLLANSFFGGGGWMPAEWGDTGTDRVVLVVPDDTEVFSGPGTVSNGQVQVGIRPSFPDEPVPDLPTVGDVFARYVSIAGRNPEDNRQTTFFDYKSVSGHVRAGDIFITAVEELQIGVGPDAKVYRIDDVNGAAILDETLEPIRTLPSRALFHDLVDTFSTR